MKKGLVMLITVASFVVVATVFAQTYPEGIVSYWKFDEGSGTIAADSVDANSGTIHGAMWALGMVGGALHFDGVNDYVQVPDSASLDSPATANEITIEAWVNIVQPRGNGYPQHYVVDSRDGSGGGYGLNVDTDQIQFWTGSQYRTFPSTVQVSTWHHVAGTYDGSEMIVYVDGAEVGRSLFAGGIVPSQGPLYIGQRYTHVERFRGIIDEVAIWSRALPPEEIARHYQNGLDGLGYEEPQSPVVPATIDIRPDRLNLGSKGRWVTCYVELPEGYSVEDIDIDSVALTKINADLLDPPVYTMGRSNISDRDGDGVPDLMVKFDRQELIPLLEAGEVELTVTGELADGQAFEGTDVIRTKGKPDKQI